MESIYMTEDATREGGTGTRARYGKMEDIARAITGARGGLEQLSKTYAGDMELVSEMASIVSTIDSAIVLINEVLSKKIYLGRQPPPE